MKALLFFVCSLLLFSVAVLAEDVPDSGCASDGQNVSTQKQSTTTFAEKLHHSLVSNSFNVGTNLELYQHDLGRDFIRRIGALKASDHWIDMGAGEARAQLDYLANGGAAKATAVSYERPKLSEQVRSLESKIQNKANFRYLEKRYLEDIPNNELGKADVITDCFGVMSYTQRIGVVIQKYLDVLKPNGAIFLHSHFPDDPYGPAHVIDKSGQEVPFMTWLAKQRGIKIEPATYLDGKPFAFKVTKTQDKVVVPSLDFVRLAGEDSDHLDLTRRIFKEK